jgi:hypothetical protein
VPVTALGSPSESVRSFGWLRKRPERGAHRGDTYGGRRCSVFARGKGRPGFYRRVCLGEGVTKPLHRVVAWARHGRKGGGDVQLALTHGWRRRTSPACAGAARGTGLGHAHVTPALRQYSRCGPRSGGHWPASASVYGEVRCGQTWPGATRRRRRRARDTTDLMNLTWPCSSAIFSKICNRSGPRPN